MKQPVHIVILGGGFGGVLTARQLEKRCKRRDDIRVTLISRDNFLLMTPLMFEACTGTLELRHCSVAIRAFLKRTQFIEGIVTGIDLERRVVRAAWGATGEGGEHEVAYDHLVLALGAVTNMAQIPGAEHALEFKTLADVIVLRNHLIECLERADAGGISEQQRRRLATIVVIGGGFVGSEVFGEVTAFMGEVLRYYPRLRPSELRLCLVQAGKRIMPEVPEELADYAMRLLKQRPGVEILVDEPVQSVEPGVVHLKDRTIESDTIVLSAGILPNPVVAALPLQRDKHGKVVVEPTLRCKERPEIWALGDCASVPDPDGKPYPDLAQFAMRQAWLLGDNLCAAVDGKPLGRFQSKMLGLMAALGKKKGLGTVMGLQVRGFFAWWLRRTYYLMVMPRWAQRVRIVADWTLALFFRPEISKVSLRRREVEQLRQLHELSA